MTTISLFDSVPAACAAARRNGGDTASLRTLLELRTQVADAIDDTSGFGSRRKLHDLRQEISETLSLLANQEAWGLLADAEDEFRTGSPQEGIRILSKFGPIGPTHLQQAVSKGALRRTYEEWLAKASTAPATRSVRVIAVPA